MGDLDGQRYPRSNMSSSHLRIVTRRLGSSGYTLQFMVSGVLGLSVIVWSHGCEGGNHCASSSLNTLAWRWYSFGISVVFWYCPAVMSQHVTTYDFSLVFTFYLSCVLLQSVLWLTNFLFSHDSLEVIRVTSTTDVAWLRHWKGSWDPWCTQVIDDLEELG